MEVLKKPLANNNSPNQFSVGLQLQQHLSKNFKTRNVFDTTLLEFDLIPESDKIELEYCLPLKNIPSTLTINTMTFLFF